VSVCFYPARDYLTLVEFDVIRSCESKSTILTDEQVYTLAQCLQKFADVVWKEWELPVIKSGSGKFRLGMPTSCRGLIRLYLGSEYICLTPLYLEYLAGIFNIVLQHLRDYVFTLPFLLSYVTMSLTSVVYVEPMPKHINYPHLYEELVSFVKTGNQY